MMRLWVTLREALSWVPPSGAPLSWAALSRAALGWVALSSELGCSEPANSEL
jgi:hypothetical protein